jgi:hypothetical protein
VSKYRKVIECREQTNIPIPGRRAVDEGLAQWLADTNGSILIQFTVILVALMGLIGLTVDGARFLMLNNDLQDLADAAALAGAADLDGSTAANNAISDAEAFASSNNVRWYDTGGTKIATVHLYQTLADAKADTNNTDTQPRYASFIRVWTGAWGVTPTFLAAVGAKKASTSAQAIAQSSIAQCVPMQAMLCNPNELTTGNFTANPGQAYVFSQTGNTGGYSPGDFNLLDTPSGKNGASDIEAYLSSQTSGSCSTSGATPGPGQKNGPMVTGINYRFDQQPNGGGKSDDQTPAPLRVSGYYDPSNASQCNINKLSNQTPSEANYATGCSGKGATVSCGLPADPAPLTTSSSTQIGTKVAVPDLQAYWSNHHSAPYPSGVTTRYGIYQAEIAGGTALAWLTDHLEPHAPHCVACTGSECVASRRILQVAVIDCNFWTVQGHKTTNIPVNTYADFFITNPSDGNIYTEYVQTHSIAAGNAPGLHQTVELAK